MNILQKINIYDLPTRILHWVFAGLFIFSFYVAKTYDDESLQFTYHMLSGLFIAFVVLIRIVWGFVGSSYSRFSSYILYPSELVRYLKSIISGDKRRWLGHNPASSTAAVVMYISALMLCISGILMSSGYKESAEEVHELFANLFLITVIIHIAGLVFHEIRNKDSNYLSMIHGKKTNAEINITGSSQKIGVGVLLILILLGSGTYLYKSYNISNKNLNLFGISLALGENEDENEDDEDENKSIINSSKKDKENNEDKNEDEDD